MKPAHTVFSVPAHIERVPAYVRKHLAQAGPKVRIGCAYSPAIRIFPAVHCPPSRHSSVPAQCLAAVAAFVLFALILAPLLWGAS